MAFAMGKGFSQKDGKGGMSVVEALLRRSFLTLAKNKWATDMAKKHGIRFGAGRFVAGETLDQAIQVVRYLNQKRFAAALDHLGEYVTSVEEAERDRNNCLRILEEIKKSNLNANLSVKLSQLGLDLSPDLCESNTRLILEKAEQNGIFVRIAMEDSSHCAATIEIFRRLRAEYDNVGLAIQAYLYRSSKDLQELQKLQASLRLVKGAYKEPSHVAFQRKAEVDQSYQELIANHLLSGNYTAVATHDETMISFTKDLVAKHAIPKTQYEFQLLYGIRTDLAERLVNEGHHVRIYVPFGNDWFGYFMRRLAERPENVRFVMKNLVRGSSGG